MPAKDEVTEFYRSLAAASQADRGVAHGMTSGLLWAAERLDDAARRLVAAAKERKPDGE
jgi:hypothetical protein